MIDGKELFDDKEIRIDFYTNWRGGQGFARCKVGGDKSFGG